MNTIEKAWYKQPYVWLLIAFPLTAVIGGIITAWLAVVSNDGLVVDDYYKRGLEINRILERDRAAQRYHLAADVQLNHEARKILVTVIGDNGFPAPDQLSVQLLHATRRGFDKQMILKKTKPNIYQGELPPLARGNWYVLIEQDNWRLLKELRI